MLNIAGVFCAPIELYADQKFLDEENEAEIIIAVEPLRGVENLHEKSIPIFRLKYPTYVPTINLHEKSQLPLNHLGEKNLEAKQIMPDSLNSKTFYDNDDYLLSMIHPKNQYENV